MKTSTHALQNATTLVKLLRQRAAERSTDRLYTFLVDGELEEAFLTYGQVDERASVVAAELQRLSARGERALLLYPPGLAYIEAFFGCLYAGVVAVPVYPPNPAALDKTLPRLRAIIADAKPAVILTTTDLLDMARSLLSESGNAQWVATDGLPRELARDWCEGQIGPDDVAFLQYTSGSTADPKGVMVSHGNLIDNSVQIYDCFGHCEQSQGVIWLPPYHDMGLIGGIIQPLYAAFPVTLMSPLHFLQKPLRWLQAISRYRATTSGGPNFAYELCIRKSSKLDREALDLSSWVLAFNGAEPIRGETLERFTATFGPHGFRREFFYPCYGLAEGTLIVTGGEQRATPVVQAFDASGLSENRAVQPKKQDTPGQTLVGCGVTRGQTLRIVDPETRRERSSGEIGEIWVAGPSVARGYWQNAEQTAQVFQAILADTGEGPFLRTGDLGFLLDGELFVTGRCKDLIIVRGRNYYPQDIERIVETSHAGLRPGCGAAFSVEHDGEEQLVVAFEVDAAHEASAEDIVAAIRRSIAQSLDIEARAIVLVKSRKIPKTSSGKIQRHACRTAFVAGELDVVRTWRGVASAATAKKVATSVDETTMQGRIAAWIAAQLGQHIDDIDVRAAFSHLGLNSLQAVSLTGELETWLGRRVPPTLAYEYPTIELLARHIVAEASPDEVGHSVTTPRSTEPVAIIGIGCRFPGARGAGAYWQLLRNGVDAISSIPAEREKWWKAAGLSIESAPRWGGFIEEPDHFDPLFFKISQREAAAMDPQQRLLLEVTFEALEDAGEPFERLRGTNVGVFIGISTNDYQRHWDTGNRFALTGNATSIAANRISYAFDFRGPSIALDTACSSSLVAIHLACQSLWNGDAHVALAGGVNLILSPNVSSALHQAGMLAPDGRCKAFDAAANGYVRGEGAGVVVLKPLSEAVAAGDRIYAVIRSTATNNDGKTNGLTAPNRHAQEAVLRRAYHAAGLDPTDVAYVETHGTGTPLGDPIEASALAAVIANGGARENACRIGSVKTNIGHLEAAAGIAGLIKTALALHHREIPATLHFTNPNPHIVFEKLGLRVQQAAEPWPRWSGQTLAGVSSFGFGGTNAHVVLQAAPAETSIDVAAMDGATHVLPLSAHSGEALQDLARSYVDFLLETDAPWADVCRGAATRRGHHDWRVAIVGRGNEDAAATLMRVADGVTPSYIMGDVRPGRRVPLVFVFGEYSRTNHEVWRNVTNALVATEIVFREVVENCDREAQQVTAVSIVAGLRDDTTLTPLTIFAVQVGLAALWRHWGIAPDDVVGRGIGNATAAYERGAVSLREAIAAIDRGDYTPFGEPESKIIEAHFMEIGPRPVLSRSLDECLGGMDQAHAASMHECVAALYSAGHSVAWSRRYATRGAWVQLPTLPWKRSRYWADPKGANHFFGAAQKDKSANHFSRHPLLGAPHASSSATEFVWENHLDLRRLPYLNDHRFDGSVVVPATAYLEMALAAATAATSSERCTLDDVRIERPLVLDDGAPVSTRVVVSSTAARHRVEILGRNGRDEGTHTLHARGTVCLDETQAPAFDLADVQKRCAHEVPTSTFYKNLEQRGLDYGPSFRGVVRVWRSHDEVLGMIKLPASLESDDDAYHVHPALLDACAQIVAALDTSDRPFLPTGAAQIRLWDKPGRIVWSYARRHEGEPIDDGERFDVCLLNETGKVFAQITGLRIQYVDHLRRRGTREQWFYRVGWEPKPLRRSLQQVRESQTFLVLADRSGVGEALAKRLAKSGDSCIFVTAGANYECLSENSIQLDPAISDHVKQLCDKLRASNGPPCRSIVHLWSLDASTALQTNIATIEAEQTHTISGVLALIKDLAARPLRIAPRIFFVTRGARAVSADAPPVAVSPATIWGLGRTLVQEHTELFGGLIDLPANSAATDDVEILFRELTCPDGENQIAHYAGQRHVARLLPAPDVTRHAPPLRYRPDGSYLITGGLGGIGLLVARWLAEHGARRLILMGRTPLPPRSEWSRTPPGSRIAEQVQSIRAIEALGASVHLAEVDVGDETQLSAFLERFRNEAWPHIRGVVHLAGVLQDQTLLRLDASMMTAVFRAKVAGAWLLHRLLAEEPLDFFFMFSSIASILGSAGQANYAASNAFLDALAHHRRALGKPAMSINWGPWAEVGLASETGRGERLARGGMASIDPQEGLRLFEQIAGGNTTQLAIMSVDWAKLARTFPLLSEQPLLTELIRAANATSPKAADTGQTAADSPRSRVLAAPPDKREAILIKMLLERVARATGNEGTTFDPDQPLEVLGIDSLTQIELQTQLETEFGVSIPMTALLSVSTITGMAKLLLAQLVPIPETTSSDVKAIEARSAIQPRVVTLQAEGSAPPLFSVHPGGLEIDCYAELAGHLGKTQPFYSVAVKELDAAYAGTADADASVASIEDLATQCLESLRGVRNQGPYRLSGWSLGGVVAFEMAQQLHEQGEHVELLALFDSPTPIAKQSPEAIDDAALVPAFAAYLGARRGRTFLPFSASQPMEFDGRLVKLLEWAHHTEVLPRTIEIRTVRSMFSSYKRGLQQSTQRLCQYRPRAYSGSIVYFRATDILRTYRDVFGDGASGWNAFTSEPLVVRDIPGDHYSMFLLPHVQSLAAELRTFLGQTLRSGSHGSTNV